MLSESSIARAVSAGSKGRYRLGVDIHRDVFSVKGGGL